MTTKPNFKSRPICSFLLYCATLAPSIYAVEHKNPKLVSLELTVNGTSREIPNGDVLNLVRGDLVVLEKAKTMPELTGGSIINLIGFRSSWKQKNSEDDSFQKIDTTLLKKGWSKDGYSEKYVILVKKNGKLIGEVTTILKNPRLVSLVLFVNGNEKILKDKEILKINPIDELRLGAINSTEKQIDESLSISMDEISFDRSLKDQELKVFHGTFEIGSINIQVER